VCGRTKTPEWRTGPQGSQTLCNACGQKWAKERRERSAKAEGPGTTTQSHMRSAVAIRRTQQRSSAAAASRDKPSSGIAAADRSAGAAGGADMQRKTLCAFAASHSKPSRAAAGSAAAVPGAPPARPSASASPPERQCHNCGTRESCWWRSGPLGSRTLCNTCGQRWAKRQKLSEHAAGWPRGRDRPGHEAPQLAAASAASTEAEARELRAAARRAAQRDAGAGDAPPSKRTAGAGDAPPSKRTDGAGDAPPSKRTDGAGDAPPSKRTDGAGDAPPSKRTDGAGDAPPSKRTDGAGDAPSSRRAVNESAVLASKRVGADGAVPFSKRACGEGGMPASKCAAGDSDVVASMQAGGEGGVPASTFAGMGLPPKPPASAHAGAPAPTPGGGMSGSALAAQGDVRSAGQQSGNRACSSGDGAGMRPEPAGGSGEDLHAAAAAGDVSAPAPPVRGSVAVEVAHGPPASVSYIATLPLPGGAWAAPERSGALQDVPAHEELSGLQQQAAIAKEKEHLISTTIQQLDEKIREKASSIATMKASLQHAEDVQDLLVRCPKALTASMLCSRDWSCVSQGGSIDVRHNHAVMQNACLLSIPAVGESQHSPLL